MLFQALILIAACLGEQIFVPVESNAEGESIVHVKQGAAEAGCDASFESPCPTLLLALPHLDRGKSKHIIKFLKGDTDYIHTGAYTDESGIAYLIQGAKTETDDEIVTLKCPTSMAYNGLEYRSETELRSLKFLLPDKFDTADLAIIQQRSGAAGIALNNLTFERMAATLGGTHTYVLMRLESKVTINNVVITSPSPWIVEEGVGITTNDACTVKNLKITNVTVPDYKYPAFAIEVKSDLTIEDSTFTNCKTEKSPYSGAVAITTNDTATPVITFKTTTFTGCTAEGGLAGALAVAHHGTEAKIDFTGADALAFTDCTSGTGDKKVATAAVFAFFDDKVNFEELAKKIKASFGKDYNNADHKNFIIAQKGLTGDKVDLAQYWSASSDAAFGVKINFALFFVALVSAIAALL